MSEPVGIGFIGAGEISILHEKALKRIPGARLVGLWNRTPEHAIQRADAYGCRRYETPEALVDDPAIQAVFVLTDLDTHLVYEAGVRGRASTCWWKNRWPRSWPISKR